MLPLPFNQVGKQVFPSLGVTDEIVVDDEDRFAPAGIKEGLKFLDCTGAAGRDRRSRATLRIL